MKKATAILAIGLSIINHSFAQAPCDSLTPVTINYSTGSHTFCSTGTEPTTGAWYNSTVVSGEGASSYTFDVNGISTVTNSVYFTAQAAGVTNFTITGDVNGCTQEVAFSFTTFVCADSVSTVTTTPPPVGIEQYSLDKPVQNALYFDMQGNPIELRYNEVVIEKVGLKVRKVRFERP